MSCLCPELHCNHEIPNPFIQAGICLAASGRSWAPPSDSSNTTRVRKRKQLHAIAMLKQSMCLSNVKKAHQRWLIKVIAYHCIPTPALRSFVFCNGSVLWHERSTCSLHSHIAFTEGLAALRIDLQLQPHTYHWDPTGSNSIADITDITQNSNFQLVFFWHWRTTLHNFTNEEMAHRLSALVSFAANKVWLDCDCKLLASNSPSKQSLRIGTLACKTCKGGPTLTRIDKKSLRWNCELRLLWCWKAKELCEPAVSVGVCRCFRFDLTSWAMANSECSRKRGASRSP